MMNPQDYRTKVTIIVKRAVPIVAGTPPPEKFKVSKHVDALAPHYDGIEISKDYVALKLGTSAVTFQQRIENKEGSEHGIQYPDSIHASIYYHAVVRNAEAFERWKELLLEQGWMEE